MQLNLKKYMTETNGYIAIGIAALLVVLLLFINYVRFLYRAVNDPFTLDKKQTSADITNFNKDEYNFVLKNLGYEPAQQSAPPSTGTKQGTSKTAPADPSFAAVKIQILNNANKNGSSVANTLYKNLTNAGFTVSPVVPTAQVVSKTQIEVKDSVRANQPRAYNQVISVANALRVLDVPQTLEPGNSFDVVIVIGSAKP